MMAHPADAVKQRAVDRVAYKSNGKGGNPTVVSLKPGEGGQEKTLSLIDAMKTVSNWQMIREGK